MANIAQEILELHDRIESAPRRPFEFMYPASLVKQAAEMFKDQDWYINGRDGSRYYHGELVKAPSESVDVTSLNERIHATRTITCHFCGAKYVDKEPWKNRRLVECSLCGTRLEG